MNILRDREFYSATIDPVRLAMSESECTALSFYQKCFSNSSPQSRLSERASPASVLEKEGGKLEKTAGERSVFLWEPDKHTVIVAQSIYVGPKLGSEILEKKKKLHFPTIMCYWRLQTVLLVPLNFIQGKCITILIMGFHIYV
jgi:hypothetical protein